jgi:HNH endonuclease
MADQLDSLCPYCKERERNSQDHIFPEFLGGTRTIGACKECNDVFGHSSEGPVCKNLAPFAVMLRKSRIKAPRYAIWRKALVHEGIEWDLDTDLVMRPSKPKFDNVAESALAVFPNERGARKWAAHRQEQGKNVSVESRTGPSIQMNATSFNFTIGTEVRRVSTKMCVAVADH